jgi:predicted glutamine amidotransferase
MMTQHFSERYESLECRFWGMIAQDVLPQTVVLDHLINLPNSLKNLGGTNPNGWGLAYYNNSQPTIRRGEPAANTDPNFNVAAQELASSSASIGMGHVRKSASPPYNVPNPHPFNRSKLGKWWTFGHHGVIDKAVLVQLIGDAYLAANPPQYGSNISEWNDSELYFIYLLKCIEENSGNVRSGVAEAVTAISSHSSSYNMDFVFSDGTTLWAFRKGDSIHVVYYYYNSTFPQYAAVASQYPTSTQGGWVFMNNYNFVELTRTGAPLVIDDIREYATIDHFDSTNNNNDGVVHGGVVISGEGKIDGGDVFHGVDDYVTVADNSTLDGDGNWQQMTVECWVKSTKDNQKATIILSKRETGTTRFNSSY